MHQKQAELLAQAVGGEAWQSGGGIWIVTLEKDDGRLVVFSGDAVCEYASEEDFDAGRAETTIDLGERQRYVICDAAGARMYEHDESELGWTNRAEAERQARYLKTREGGEWFVREQ